MDVRERLGQPDSNHQPMIVMDPTKISRRRKPPTDFMDMLEASYALEQSPEAWTHQLPDATRRACGGNVTLGAVLYRLDDTAIHLDHVAGLDTCTEWLRIGKHYILARQNALGRSNKMIAYGRGAAHATVRVLPARSAARQVKMREELIARFASAGVADCAATPSIPQLHSS